MWKSCRGWWRKSCTQKAFRSMFQLSFQIHRDLFCRYLFLRWYVRVWVRGRVWVGVDMWTFCILPFRLMLSFITTVTSVILCWLKYFFFLTFFVPEEKWHFSPSYFRPFSDLLTFCILPLYLMLNYDSMTVNLVSLGLIEVVFGGFSFVPCHFFPRHLDMLKFCILTLHLMPNHNWTFILVGFGLS